jgi:hypothetical protein
MAHERLNKYSAMNRQRARFGDRTIDDSLLGGDRIAVTGTVGTFVEGVANAWDGSRDIAQSLRDQIFTLAEEISLRLKGLPADEYVKAMRAFGLSEKAVVDDRQTIRPTNPAINSFFNLIDAALASPLMERSFQLLTPKPVHDPVLVDDRVVYVVRAGQAIAKEIISPSFNVGDGHLHPDFRSFGPNGLEVQFDSLLTQHPFPKISRDADLLRYFMETTGEYAVVQIKLFTYSRYDDPGWLTSIFPSHHRYLRDQMASVALAFDSRGEYFTFPLAVYFVYLRPTAPTAIHELKITSWYLKTWSLQIEFYLRDMIARHASQDEIETLLRLQRLIDEDAEAREIIESTISEEERAESLLRWSAVGSLEQGFLIDLNAIDSLPKKVRPRIRRHRVVPPIYKQGGLELD